MSVLITGPYGEKIAPSSIKAVKLSSEYTDDHTGKTVRDVLVYNSSKGYDYWPFWAIETQEAQRFYDEIVEALERRELALLGGG